MLDQSRDVEFWRQRIAAAAAQRKGVRAGVSDSGVKYWDEINRKTEEVLADFLVPGM